MTTETSYSLPAIPYLRLRFHLRAEHACTLPGYKGSLLRGAFGHALRRTVCVQGPKHPCETCMLRSQCVYTRLFEPYIEGEPPRFLRGLNTAPRPYVFEPVDLKKAYSSGELLQFDLLLVGHVIDLYTFVIYAVQKMAQNGLGRHRYRFKLDSVFCNKISVENTQLLPRVKNDERNDACGMNMNTDEHWYLLFSEDTLLGVPMPHSTIEQAPSDKLDGTSNLGLSFITPTRLKFANELAINFTFRQLVFKMLRRTLELAHFHVPGTKVDWDFHHVLVAADRVIINSSNLKWVDWTRHSSRQQNQMKLGGFVGEIMLEGSLSPFLHLLRTCEVIHVGKGAVFGNGKLRLKF